MIRLSFLLLILTFVGHENLPKWRARFTGPFFSQCLKITPETKQKSEIQSLVCGATLHVHARRKTSPEPGANTVADSRLSTREAWRGLGLIHILVVSGGHLSILAGVLALLSRAALARVKTQEAQRIGRRFSSVGIAIILVLFCLANRLQPPVLRALTEWFMRRHFERRGWRAAEIALMSTWFALPFSSSLYDLLSLALSFFASVTVEQTARSLHRFRWLSRAALPISVWWMLLPFLFTMGVPHPLASMANILLAPLLGATLIPLAMLTWASGILPAVSGTAKDPIGLGCIFDFAWERLSIAVLWLAQVLPSATPRIAGVKPLHFGIELSTVLILAIFSASGALLVRADRERRRERLARSRLVPLILFGVAIATALFFYAELQRGSAPTHL